MALFKIHKDLINHEPGLLPYLLGQFDGEEIDVTTAQDHINQVKAYLVSGPGVPSEGQLEFTMSKVNTVDVPLGATLLKDKFISETGEYLVWYECF